MQRFRFRNSAKALSASVVAAAIVFTPSSVGFMSALAAAPQRAAVLLAPFEGDVEHAVIRPSVFDKEQAMSEVERIARWSPYIQEAARRFDISEDWIRAVIRMESGGRTFFGGKPITSHAGAMGIMQLMPQTYGDMKELHGLGDNPYDPRNNVLAGTAYLRWLYEKFGYPKMFAAYNAGPGTLQKQMAGARRLPLETRNYVRGIAQILDTATAADEAAEEPEKLIATLTRPDGSTITIDAETVNSIRPSLPNEFVPGVRTVVAMGDREQGVTEDLATVASVLKRPSGTL
jgi:soluble lytic murein transglycosylase-like protein